MIAIELWELVASSVPLPTPSPSDTPAGGAEAPAPDFVFSNLVTIILAVVGSSALTAWVTGRQEKTRRREDIARLDARAVMLSLKAARAVFMKYGTSSGNASDPDRDLRLVAVANDLIADAALTNSDEVIDVADKYIEVGELYAAGDEDTSTEDEMAAFRAVVSALRVWQS